VTLVIGMAWDGVAIQASDRFLSVPNDRRFPTGEFDSHSNKALAVCGSDCRLVVGYSGLAYLDRKNTDQVIAEAITGLPDLNETTIGLWNHRGIHYRKIRDRIEASLSAAFARLPAKVRDEHSITVLAAGFQRMKLQSKSLGPKGSFGQKNVMFRVVVNKHGSRSGEIMAQTLKELRQQGRRIPFHAEAIGTSIPFLRKITHLRLGAYILGNPSPKPEGARDILMDEVAATAALRPDAVGGDVVGLISSFNQNMVHSHFKMADRDKHEELLARVVQGFSPHLPVQDDLDGVPAPWLLGPGGQLYGPSFGNGGWTSVGSGFEFKITGLPDEQPQSNGPGIGGFFGRQPRKDQYGRYRD
jgi:hypothetical protein